MAPTSFSVSLIPHTAAETVLLRKRAGDVVNLENDIVGKYVQKLLGGALVQGRTGTAGSASRGSGSAASSTSAANGGLTLDYLQANGF